ncbi:endonuclease domain-containing protein [Rhodococcus sp. MSC1_016]
MVTAVPPRPPDIVGIDGVAAPCGLVRSSALRLRRRHARARRRVACRRELNRSVDPDEFRDLCITHRGRHGAPAARLLLRHAALRAASEPERVLGRELSLRGCPLEANHPIGPYSGDFVDEQAQIVVEVDGREFHSDPKVFRNDRRRQNWLVREGWMVLRFAAYDVLAHPDVIADEIVTAVRRRRRSRR